MSALARRELLAAAAAAPALWLPGRSRAGGSEPVVETAFGKLRGRRERGVEIYRGVPYGGPVAGPNRFRRAVAPAAWAGIRDAGEPGPPSIQPSNGSFGVDEPAPSEDCLTLTIWTPAADRRRRPVLVYNHGGGFSTGSCASPLQDGANLALRQDVVVVATNHRLGALGFLYLAEVAGADYASAGCNGVLDIVLGLEWVKENIEAFGGDPGNVTIFGESGGALKSACLYAMPEAAAVFHKASLESGPGLHMIEPETARRMTARVLRELDLSPARWRELLEIPTSVLLAIQQRLSGGPDDGAFDGGPRGVEVAKMGFGPVVDGTFLPRHPFDPDAPATSSYKPLMVGYNRDEFAFFALYSGDLEAFRLDEAGLRGRIAARTPAGVEQIMQLYGATRPGATPSDIYVAYRTARFAAEGTWRIAELKAAQRATPVYAYRFDYQLEERAPGSARRLGAMHGLDIAFKFDNADHVPVFGRSNFAGWRPERLAAARSMSALWAGFARTGAPHAPGLPAWPAYSLDRRATMIVDARCRVADDPDAAERRFWETFQ